MKHVHALGSMLLLVSSSFGHAQRTSAPAIQVAAPPATPRIANFTGLPLRFEANRGQTDPYVRFLSRGKGYTLFLAPADAILVLQGAAKGATTQGEPAAIFEVPSRALRMRLLGADPESRISGENPLQCKSNYFLGSDAKKWQSNIPNFARVRYKEIYPGIDLVYYGMEGHLKYDFVVHPHSDPNLITLQIAGADFVKVTPQGDLSLRTAEDEIDLLKPVVFQRVGGKRHKIAAHYVIARDGIVKFQLLPTTHDCL